MSFVIPQSPQPSVEIAGSGERFPVHSFYCVGRNYAKHAREMGMDPDREPPFFFSKPADAIVANGTRLQEGDQVAGMTIREINEFGVVLEFESYLVDVPVFTDWEE